MSNPKFLLGVACAIPSLVILAFVLAANWKNPHIKVGVSGEKAGKINDKPITKTDYDIGEFRTRVVWSAIIFFLLLGCGFYFAGVQILFDILGQIKL